MQKVLIVGAGLSGICLSHHFLEENVEITLIDNGVNHSSLIAAGLINPLVFRRMTKSWRVDAFLPYAKKYYETLELRLGQKFFHPLVIRRFFSSEQERNYWLDRQTHSDFSEYMTEVNQEDESIYPYANKFGSGRVKNAGFVDALLFDSETKKELKKKIESIQGTFDYSKLDPATGTYLDQTFDLIVFAEGYLGTENPWFNFLPLTQTKGEVLEVQLSLNQTNESLNRKCFMLPLSNGNYKVGSTYSWDDPSSHPTEEGKNHILENLSYLTPEKPAILDHKAGVRPTTKDRRPFIGLHPTLPKLAIFNGLGAKGYLIAPLLAKEFVSSMIHGSEIDVECQLLPKRFQ